MPGFIHATNSTNITFSGGSGTCPRPGCHGRARIISGTYDFGPGGEAVARASFDMPLPDLQRLLNVLQGLDPRDVTPEHVARVAPELAPVVAGIDPERFKTWLSTLVAILGLLIAWQSHQVAQESLDVAKESLRVAEQDQAAQHEPLDDRQIAAIVASVRDEMERSTRGRTSRPKPADEASPEARSGAKQAGPKRKKRAPKQHGKRKQKKRK